MKQFINILLVGSMLTACQHKQPPAAETENGKKENLIELTSAQLQTAGIITGKMEKRAIASVVKANGQIDVPPQNMVSISFPMGGFLKSTNLLPGMQVKKGQVIGIMEDQSFIQLQQDYLTSAARLNYLEKEYNRQRELNRSKATSDKLFEQVEAEYNSQRILKESVAEKLSLIGVSAGRLKEGGISKSVSILSPINGFVSKVNVNIGKYVMPSDVLFEIVNPSDIHLALTVFEKDLPKLSVGQLVTAYTNNNPEKKYPCKIILIGRDLSANRSVEVHCHFENYDSQLIPGTFMNGEIQASNTDSWTLPEDAVVRYENKEYVFCKRGNNIFEMVPVKVGNHENGYVEVLLDNDLSLTNQEFATKGAYSILMKVKNTEAE